MLESVDNLLAYDHWANRETLASLRRAGNPPERALAIMAHIVAALALWHERLTHEGRVVEVWPSLTLTELESEIELLFASWTAAVAARRERPDEAVAYTNSKGEPFSSTLRQILTHVMLHGSYHRGQIATLLKNAGFTPAYTDYIHAVRQGYV